MALCSSQLSRVRSEIDPGLGAYATSIIISISLSRLDSLEISFLAGTQKGLLGAACVIKGVGSGGLVHASRKTSVRPTVIGVEVRMVTGLACGASKLPARCVLRALNAQTQPTLPSH